MRRVEQDSAGTGNYETNSGEITKRTQAETRPVFAIQSQFGLTRTVTDAGWKAGMQPKRAAPRGRFNATNLPFEANFGLDRQLTIPSRPA